MKIISVFLFFISSFVLADSLAPVIDNSAYPAGAVVQNTASTSSSMNSTFELMNRLDEAQVEIQQLNGKLEEQAYLMAEIKKKQAAMYTDFDERLQQIESKLNGSKSTNSTETAQPVTKESDTVEPTLAKSTSATTNQASPAVIDEKKQQYLQAFEAFRNGQVTEAIALFNTLLSKDPTNLYANNAQFWLGEAYRVNKDMPAAKKAFGLVLEKYPTSQKVPEALLKLATIEQEQHNSAKAKEYLTRIITDFSTSKLAQIAAKKLQLLNDTPN